MTLSALRAQRVQSIATNGDKPLAQRKLGTLVAAAALIFTAGFAQESQASNWFSDSVNSSATHYQANQALRGGDVNEGVIEAVQVVNINAKRNVGTGTALGGAIGAAAGYTVTRNSHNSRARSLGTLLGTALGAGVGASVQNMGSNHPGLRIIVRTTDGRGHVSHKAFVQDNDQPGIAVGATVAIVRDGGQNRVVPIDPGLGQRISNDERAQIQGRYDNGGRYEEGTTRYVRDDGYANGATQGATNPEVVQQIIRRGNYRP